MGEFRVHHVRFFEYVPKAIHSLAYEPTHKKFALSRSDGSVEIWSITEDWYQEKIIPASEGFSVEALVWQGKRLYSAGLDGNVTEYDLLRLQPKISVASNGGPVWCLTSNSEGTQLAAGTEEGCVVLFDTETGVLEYHRSLDRQEGRILSIAWHSADGVIVTGGVDNIRLWSVSSGHALQRLTVGRQERNKETIVWCLAVTSDMTVVSGDSRGKTCFWNGKQGTLIKSFQSHKSDVYCMAVSMDEKNVITSGVDPTVMQFEYIQTQANSEWKTWVRSSVRMQHTHDVRALAFAENFILSAGVDTNLVINAFDHGSKLPPHIWRKVSPIPTTRLVCVAKKAKMLLLRYPRHLEVWTLGHTNRVSDKNGEILSLKSKPVKLVQLLARTGSCIVCSAISSDGRYVAYSDEKGVRLYTMSMDKKDVISAELKVDLRRIKTSPGENVSPAHRMVFGEDGCHLVTATNTAEIQVLDITESNVTVLHTFRSSNDAEPIHLLSISSDSVYVAVADHHSEIRLYNIRTNKHVCNLPAQGSKPSAMTFSPHNSYIVVAYCNHQVFEFDVKKREFTAWSRQYSHHFPRAWSKRYHKITNIAFNPRSDQQLLMEEELTFIIIDKSQPFPDKNVNLESDRRESHGFHLCNNYKYIMCIEPLSDDWLVVVERTPLAIAEQLPPALKQKKFGT
ncbi:U3 small nucleolar RNA-associated protein 4 homolog [Gigantopelta aegis]|uniref:U3 small nucleolar RNA-associated protein 4 homolog n=1 Tax=Gigantopelta aegis TaxID=1735272 RepID=UPI001B88E297|nr:U3 small nucleolar RNA-associated protein 4 homolog [Gigantopelta aegis]